MGKDKNEVGKAFSEASANTFLEQKGLCAATQRLACSKWLEVGFGALGNL